MSTKIPQPAFSVDFETGETNLPNGFQMMNGASVKDGAPGIVSKALRIDCDGPHVIFPNLDISPSKMPEVSMIIEFYLESIPEGSKGWLLNHDNGGYDRALVLHDERFNGISHGVGYPAGPVYDTYTQPEIGKWIQMVVTYRQGGECAVFMSNDKAPITHEGKNNDGKSSLTLGRVTNYKNHWCDCWIKGVSVYDKGLSDEEVDAIFGKFKEDIIVPSGEASDDEKSVEESVDEGESVGEPVDDVVTDYTTKACTIGEAWSPHRAMINHKNFSQDQWDNGLNMDCAGWSHHTRFWAFPTKQPGTIRIAVGHAHNPHRICINHECQTQEEYNNGASMTVAGWTHHSDFWAYPTKQPGTIRIAVGTAFNPHRHHLNHAGQSQEEYNNGASMSVYGWTHHCEFWAYPSDQTHEHVPEPVVTDITTKACTIGEAWSPHRAMINHKNFSQDQWDSGLNMDCAGWSHHTRFWAFPTKQPGTIRIAVGHAHNPHRICINHECQTQEEYNNGASMTVAGWTHHSDFWAYPTKQPGTIRIAVGTAFNPHRHHLNHAGQSQEEYNNGASMSVYGWTHHCEFWAYPSNQPLPEPIISIKEGDEFFYAPWGGRCIASFINGSLIMNRVGSSSKGIKTWLCKNADETKKLLCGLTVGIEWDNKGKYLKMTATDKDTLKVMHGNKAYFFKRMMPLPAGSAFNYGPWGGKCVVSYGPTGKMYLGRTNVARTAKAYCMSMRNVYETDCLRAGHPVNVNWDNRNTYHVQMTMTNPSTLSVLHSGNRTYKFTKM